MGVRKKGKRPAQKRVVTPGSPRRRTSRGPTAAQRQRAARIYDLLAQRYPDAHCELDFKTPHELLIATILSAQATDVAVNKATPALFARFPAPADYARATPQEIEPFVRSLGFFRNKAKAVHAAMTRIVTDHGGRVPETMDELLTLRGVARKTANVMLGNAFGKAEGIVVDTHVIRLANRLGLTRNTDPGKIEAELMALFPRERWTMLSHLLIFHGRRSCRARNALCANDPICIEFCANAAAERKARRRAGGRPSRRSKLG